MGRLLQLVGGMLAVVISFVFVMAMLFQPAEAINMRNGFSHMVTSTAGMLAVVGTHQTRWGVMALIFLVVGFTLMSSWQSFLFWPSAFLIGSGLSLEIAFRNRGDEA